MYTVTDHNPSIWLKPIQKIFTLSIELVVVLVEWRHHQSSCLRLDYKLRLATINRRISTNMNMQAVTWFSRRVRSNSHLIVTKIVVISIWNLVLFRFPVTQHQCNGQNVCCNCLSKAEPLPTKERADREHRQWVYQILTLSCQNKERTYMYCYPIHQFSREYLVWTNVVSSAIWTGFWRTKYSQHSAGRICV